jgi:hypothetical protein
MAGKVQGPSRPVAGQTGPVEPVVLPDVATQPHPAADAASEPADDPKTRLQDVLPEINQIAQKVGGYQRLAEIVETLNEMGK